MQAEEDSGAEGVSGPGGAGDVLGAELERALPDILALARSTEAAFREMDDHKFLHALLEQRPGGVADGDGVELAVGATELEARDLAGLDLVDDAVVDGLEGGADDPGEAVAVLADNVDAGFETGGLGGAEDLGGLGHELGIRRVHGVKQQEVAEVEDLGLKLGEIDVRPVPEGVGPAVVEERAATPVLLGHDVGEGRGGLGRGAEVLGVDLVLLAVGLDGFAVGVLPDEAGTDQGEPGPELGEVEEEIVGRASGSLVLRADVGELFTLGIDVDHFDLVDDPVAAGNDAAT